MLVYSALCSLDGYVADEAGGFGWAQPDEEVHTAVNDLLRTTTTYLYGRRMYDVLSVWDTWDTDDEPEPIRDYSALWRNADKVVYSRTLASVETSRTRLEREFDAEAVRDLKERTDVAIGGPTLARAAFDAGLVDAVHLFVSPVVVGGGLPALPPVALSLRDVVRYGNGTVHLHYDVA
jgi:dihydrofolate reductase